MLSQAICASKRVFPCRSTLLYQHFTKTRLVTTVAEDKQIARPPVRTAYLRTWEPIKHVGDAYSLLRALEHKYGKVLEAHFAKDYEEASKYQMIAWIVFEDPKSLQRIPLGGVEFATPASGISKEQHELSLDDIEALSQSEDYDEGYEFPIIQPERDVEVIGGRITRSDADYSSSVGESIYQQTPKIVMTSFLQWGGFHKLAPLHPPRDIVEAELFGKTPLDSVRMRTALQLASQITKMRNPALAYKDTPKASSSSSTEPSIGSLLFGEVESSKPSETETGSTSSSSISIKPTTASSLKSPTPKPAEASPSPPPPKVKDAATIAQELASQEALKRQLEFAKQLNERSSMARRRQPKPQIKVPKPKNPQFFADEFLPQDETSKPKTGVLDKLWGMFGRK